MDYQVSQRIANAAAYPFAEIDKKVNALKAEGKQVIDFGVGDPMTPTPDFVIDALTPAGHKYATSGYPSYIGMASFRQAAADFMHREYHVKLDPAAEISSTIGSKEAVFHFPLAYIDGPDDMVICPTPGYPPYKVGTNFAGGTPYFVPLLEENNFLIDFKAIPQDICDRAKIIWTNYPNSPTGALAPRQYLTELAAWAQANNIIIAADEGCYDQIYFDEKPVSMLEVTKKGVIVIYSLSKRNNMTGYRVGFVAGDQEIVNAFQKVKTNIDSGTPNFVQEAAIAAMNDTAHAHQMCQLYTKKREILLEAMTSVGLPHCESDATFYIWQKAPAGKDGEWLANKLLQQAIVVTPGGFISDSTTDGINPGVNYVRFALVPTLEQMHEAAARIKQIDMSV